MNGKLLRELRKNKGIGQAELAKRVGVTQGMISQLELSCRNPLPNTLEAIARELGCTVDDLAGEPSAFVRLMRNCKGLLPAQLLAINEVVLQFRKLGSPAEEMGSRRAQATNMPNAPLRYPCSVCGSNSDCQFVGSDPCPRR